MDNFVEFIITIWKRILEIYSTKNSLTKIPQNTVNIF